MQVSEKLMGDEPWRNGVDRAVKEELGTVLPDSYQVGGVRFRGYCQGIPMLVISQELCMDGLL